MDADAGTVDHTGIADTIDPAAIPAPRMPTASSPPATSPAVVRLTEAVDALVLEGVLPVGLSAGDRPFADVTALMSAVARVEAVLAMRLAAAEDGGALPFVSMGGAVSRAYWSRTRAKALSRAGRLANQRPNIAQPWLAGAIVGEHVDTAAKGTTGLAPDSAAAVLDGLSPLWGHVTPATVATYCARARAIVEPDDGDATERAQKAHDARFLAFSTLSDTVHITGSLPRLDGEMLMNTLNATAERTRVAGDGLTRAQRRADALLQLAAARPTEPSGGVPNPVATVTLTVGLGAVTEGGWPLSAPETRFVMCDPTVVPVLTDTDYPDRDGSPTAQRLAALIAHALDAPQPLALGRTQRVASAGQRRALAVRDGGCIMPGCEVTARNCQIHHLTPWTEGGRTDLSNLVSLCWAHHRQVDLGRWEIHPATADPPGPLHSPANNAAPFTIVVRPRIAWRREPDG